MAVYTVKFILSDPTSEIFFILFLVALLTQKGEKYDEVHRQIQLGRICGNAPHGIRGPGHLPGRSVARRAMRLYGRRLSGQRYDYKRAKCGISSRPAESRLRG